MKDENQRHIIVSNEFYSEKETWWLWQILSYLAGVSTILIGLSVLVSEKIVSEKYRLIIGLEKNEAIVLSFLFVVAGSLILYRSVKAHLHRRGENNGGGI